jgi:hypothetical protein
LRRATLALRAVTRRRLAANRSRYARRVSANGAINWQRRAARALTCALLAIVLCTAAAPVALAAGSAPEGQAFSELSKAAEAEPSTTTAKTETTGTSTSSSNSKKTVIIAVGAAVVLLVAIAFVIVRDARRVAPAGDGPLNEARAARDSAATLRKRRQKAKAARQQRKRNR